MSDEAPVEAPVETPAAEGAPPPADKPPVKPRTPDDDFEELLKKNGGLKYKAAGKEKSITSTADLRRLLSRVDGTESAATEALKAKTEADGIKSRVAALAKMQPRDRLRALADIGIDPRTLREAVEEEILADDDRQKSQAQLSPKERELQARIGEQQAKLAEYERMRSDWEAKQEEDKQVAQSSQLYEKITTVAAQALQKSKIAATHAPKFLPAIAAEMDRAERLGLEYDVNDLAETVLKEHSTLARDYYSGLDLDAHLDELRAMEMPDPEDEAKKTTRLKLMMRAEARRIRGAMNGSPAPTHVAGQPQTQGRELTAAEKIDAARTFGGGWRG